MPIQISLTSEILKFFREFGIPEENVPQIWDIDGRLIVVDGHHTLYHYLTSGIDKIMVNYFEFERYKNDPAIAWLIDDLRQKLDYCQSQGITKFLDLKNRIF